MAVVGSAEVVVRAITRQVKRDIEKAFKDATPQIQAAGDRAGKDWSDSFASSAKSSLQGSLDDIFDGVNAKSEGDRAGRDFALGAADGIDGGSGGIGSAAERAMGGAGRRGGNAFTRALNSSFADASVAASRAFTTIYAMANIAGTAVSGLIASVSTLVSGLYAMGSAASVAAGSLAVLPGMIGMAIQSMAGLRLAFGGFGDAVSAGMEQSTDSVNKAAAAAVDNSAAIAAARRAIADAERGLARARQDAAQAMFDADRRVSDAARDLAEAQQEVLNVQRELNAARQEAAENLQQLAFSAEDAALAEDRAAINLEKAYEKMVEAQSLPPDDRARREAELSYKEAELSYRQAKDRSADLAKEQKRAAKAGVEGSEEVLSVREKIRDAEEGVNDAERSLADARMARARQAQQNAQSIADAQRALADAQRRLAEAQAENNKQTAAAVPKVDKYAEAMAKLSPQAQSLVRYLVSLQDEFAGLRAAAGADLFPRLERALRPIVSKLFPILEEQLRVTGRIWGDYAVGVSNALTRGTLFERLLKSQNKTMDVFNRRGGNGRTVMDDLTTVLLRVMNAIQPLTRRFARWVASLVEGWEAATDTKEEMKKLTGFFDKAGDRAALLGDIFGNLWGVLRGLGSAGDEAGEGLLESLNEWLEGLNEWVNSQEGQDKLGTYFEGVADNMRALGDLARAIGRAFGGLGDNKGIAEFSKGMEPAVENIGKIIDQMSEAGGPFAEFITNLTDIAVALADTEGIETFFNVINAGLGPIADFAKSDFGKRFLIIAGTIAAVLRALSFMRIVGTKAIQILIGGPIAAMKSFGRLLGNIRRLIGGLRGTSKASDGTKAAFQRQMATDKQKVAALKAVARQADLTAGALTRAKRAGMPAAGAAGAAGGRAAAGAGAAAGRNATRATPLVVPPTTATKSAGAAGKAAGATSRMGKVAKGALKPLSLLTKGFGALSMALLGVSAPVVAIIAGLVLLAIGLKKLYSASPEFKKFVDNIVDKLKALGKWFTRLLTEYVVPFLNKFFGWVNDVLPKVGDKFVEVGTAIWDAVAPVFNSVKNIVMAVLPVVLKIVKTYLSILFKFWKTVFKALWAIVKFAFKLIKGYVVNILVPYIKLIWKVIQVMWKVAKGVFKALWTIVKTAFNVIKAVWRTVLKPVVAAIVAGFQWIWQKVKDVVKNMLLRWDVFKRRFGLVKDFLGSAIGKMKDFFQGLWDKVTTVVAGIRDKFGTFKDAVGGIWTKVKDTVGNIKDKFGEIPKAIGRAFGGLKDAAGDKLNTFIDFLNDKVIGNINRVTGKFGLEIPEIPGFAEGGWTGPGGKHKVAGIVHADEFVITKAARRQIERNAPGALEAMNKTGALPASSLPMGDWGPLGAIGGAIKDKAGGAWNSFENLAKAGVGKVLGNLVDGAIDLMGGAGVKRGMFVNDFFYAIMDKLKESVKNWGSKKQDKAEKEAAPKGRGGGTTKVNDPSNPRALSYWKGGKFSNRMIAHLKAAERLANTAIHVMQGGWRPTTSYSGTSHHGDAIDLQVSMALLKALRKVGIAAGDRTGLGNWAPHIHAIPGPKAGYGGGSAIFQWADYIAKGGINQSARSTWGLAQGGVALARPGGVHAIIAESGQNERVEPLNREGMSKRDQAMIDMIQNAIANKSGDTFHVHPAPGMDESTLAMMVSRRVAWRRSAGT